jgi:16S rRNA C967 or C1407 C5-methylase (RsmB/RsmF family)
MQLVERLEKKLKLRLQKCEYAPFGFKIVAPKNINLLETEEFENGFFEIQDEGSQLVALRAECKPGDLILDYCGGSGGKSLALAHLLQGRGQIFVH